VPASDILPTPEDAAGSDLGEQRVWRGVPYFESARGHTAVVLESQPENSPAECWQSLLTLNVYVLPSKIGEARYECMTRDLQAVSRSLLVDLYGKSKQTHDIRYSKEARTYTSREQELTSIHKVLGRLSELLAAVALNPASRVATEPCVKPFWGCERLLPSAIITMSRAGVSPQRAPRPVLVNGRRRIETFDIAEHRVIRAFLEILQRRAKLCGRLAQEHAPAIQSERHLRHVRLGNQPSLYETVDVPKLSRLKTAGDRAFRAATLTKNLQTLPFLRAIKPELVSVRGGAFQRGQHYRSILSLIRRFLLTNAVWYEGDEMAEVTKLTSRLYEQWCYLKIIDAFRHCGVELVEWTDALRDHLRSRFILDFDRGLAFEGLLASNVRLRFRYEPWILGLESAIKAGETLCRGSRTDVAWSPDIVIECLVRDGGEWLPVYTLVLDCKYKTGHQPFDGIMKYLEIRCTKTRQQLVKQLWLLSPAHPEDGAAIMSEDPAVSFSLAGPSCAPDETVRFRLLTCPEADTPATDPPSSAAPFNDFALGTVNFLRRQFT